MMVGVDVAPFEVEVRTRAGELVRADKCLPRDRPGQVPVPSGASPYRMALRHSPVSTSEFPFIDHGATQSCHDHAYAHVAMDTPGTGRSERPWAPVPRHEVDAIHDMIEHVAGLERSGGKVGMAGKPNHCWVQWDAARTPPPRLATIATVDGAIDMDRDWTNQGGIPMQGFLNSGPFGSMLPQHQANGGSMTENGRERVFDDMYARLSDDALQHTRTQFPKLDRVHIPVFSIGPRGRAPPHSSGNIDGYRLVKEPKQLPISDVQIFAETQAPFGTTTLNEAELPPWYEHHLEDVEDSAMDRAAVRVFVQGENHFLAVPAWPPSDASITEPYPLGGVMNSLDDGSPTEAIPSCDGGAARLNYPGPHWMAGVRVIGRDGVRYRFARGNTFDTTSFERAHEFTGQATSARSPPPTKPTWT